MLPEQFELSSKREPYIAEWHSLRKSQREGWVEYAENLKHLMYKVYSDLNEKDKDVINVILANVILVQLQNPKVAFNIKQKL